MQAAWNTGAAISKQPPVCSLCNYTVIDKQRNPCVQGRPREVAAGIGTVNTVLHAFIVLK